MNVERILTMAATRDSDDEVLEPVPVHVVTSDGRPDGTRGPTIGLDRLIAEISEVISGLVRFSLEPENGIEWLTAETAIRSLLNARIALDQLYRCPTA
jgi:hypothetical protein